MNQLRCVADFGGADRVARHGSSARRYVFAGIYMKIFASSDIPTSGAGNDGSNHPALGKLRGMPLTDYFYCPV
ncbi:hypothetical protein SIM91_03230 [Rhodococcus opacus]|uniref:hypothetical protein n=1 Tax=Rhodococcus opacus TaxID=37919 RepID=UPI0012DA9FFF|nr:hypothetical protein [Rhodococcus opacus]MDX5962356.1 hypothetical protein [Rhodococcus opacus]